MSFGNDLPNEHGVSQRQPSLRGSAGKVHIAQSGRKGTFYPTPPLNARTFSFYTQKNSSNSRVVGENPKRRGLAIQNLSNESVFVSVGSEAGFDGTNFTNAIELPVNGYFEFPAGHAPINDIFAVSLTGGAHIVIIESNIAG